MIFRYEWEKRFWLLVFGYIIVMTVSFILTGYGENYSYNMTQSEKEQFNLSELCYVMQDDLTIEALDDYCKESYDDLDSHYGDKIK